MTSRMPASSPITESDPAPLRRPIVFFAIRLMSMHCQHHRPVLVDSYQPAVKYTGTVTYHRQRV